MSNFFPLDQKVPGSKAGWPLIYSRSKVRSGCVELGQGPSLCATLPKRNLMRVQNKHTYWWWVQLNFFWPSLGQVSLLWMGKIPKFFNFFPTCQKKLLWVISKITRGKDGSASYLVRVKSMFRSVQDPSLIDIPTRSRKEITSRSRHLHYHTHIWLFSKLAIFGQGYIKVGNPMELSYFN